MMNGNEEGVDWPADLEAPAFAALHQQLHELFSVPMGFAELAMAVASHATPRFRSDYERYRLPSRN